jgi:DNA polymerase-3 subunit beta
MKLTIERAALLKALGHVQSVVERRNTIPILSNVLLSAERDKLSFSATDLDMEIVDEAEPRSNVARARSPRRPTPSTRSSASCPTAPTSR